jgi:GT2 family glycosyltransferase
VTTKIDHAIRIGQAVLASGWSDGPAQMSLCANGTLLPTRRFSMARPDVARHLGKTDANDLGWVLLAEGVTSGSLELGCLGSQGGLATSYPLRLTSEPMSADAKAQLGAALEHLVATGKLDLNAVEQLGSEGGVGKSACAFAAGAVDEVWVSTDTRQGVASGWLVRLPGVDAWLEDGQGRKFALEDAHWGQRPDITLGVPADLSGHDSTPGFLVRLEGVDPQERIRLVARSGDEEVGLSQSGCRSWGGDPVAASRWLFSHPTPMTDLATRIPYVDLPVIESLIQVRQKHWAQLPVRIEEVGVQPSSPKVTVVVPLYGRFDFVEHQLAEFARDQWMAAHAELIYVIDDKDLVDRMASEAWTLERLYGVPFRWIWGGTNRGFAGANNLGAAHARADSLIFLNSDAFPRQPGWARAMVDTLESEPDMGAVGARLLFADGSIQHAGMEFRRRKDLGIWTNHHPRMGMDPALDSFTSLTEVACVTGACLAVRGCDLERVGGWDTGYLIGDFEDSDLCLKLRAAGMRIGYLPSVELTHLERQSFKLLGTGDYRTRVVIYNAVRHQQRWGFELAGGQRREVQAP